MAKKRKLLDFDPDLEPELDDDELSDDDDPPFDILDDDEYDDRTADLLEFSIAEADIHDLCGSANARRGLGLFLRGAVHKRAFDGHAIRAKVTDDSAGADTAYDFDELEYQCSCPAAKGRGGDHGCIHVAALLYAWLREPQSFELANLGAALELYTRQPELFSGSGLDPELLQSWAEMWESAPPKLRRRISQMSVHTTPEQAAQLETQLKAFSEQARDAEFSDLLGRLTLEQLHAIAKRRHWPLRATAKAKAIAELIAQLRIAPLPDVFAPEEEQLVRIQNTLWGLEQLPTHQSLLADWQAHAGGNLARLEHALEGLQNAGVLFPCTGENMGLHYHWSPFVRSDMLPLLQPNVALSPSKGAQAPAALPPPLPLLTVMDAVLIFAEREPLRMLAPLVDPRLAGDPRVGSWPYLPEELKGLTERRGIGRQLPAALTVPLHPFFVDETLDALGAMAGEPAASTMHSRGAEDRESSAGGQDASRVQRRSRTAPPGRGAEDRESSAGGLRDYGAWAAAMLVQAGVIQTTAVGETTVDPARVSAWHLLAPDQKFEHLWRLWCAGASAFGDFRMALRDKEFLVRRSLYTPQFTPQTLAAEMGLARKFVARVLAMLSPQTWYAWPAFAACIRRLRSGFLYTFTGSDWWWLEHAPSAKRYAVANPQQWDAAWLPLLQGMFTGPLRWFGAIELAGGESSAGGELSAFRITPLGAWLFTEGRQGHVPVFAAAVAEAGPPVAWLDETTFRARATPDAMRALAPLRVFAEPARELLTFRVSMPAIGRALAQGAAAASIVKTFAAAGLPLGAAVQGRIETLVSRAGRLNLYERVTVLELGDDIALRELLATTTLRAHIVHQFSPRLIVVRDEAVETLLAELVRKGHTPLLA